MDKKNNRISVFIATGLLKFFIWLIDIFFLNLDKILGIIILMFIGLFFFYAICESIKHQRAEENEIKAEMSRLEEAGWTGLRADPSRYSHNYNSAELLARKRCDEKFGENKYIFQSTNFSGYVWYYAEPKK